METVKRLKKYTIRSFFTAILFLALTIVASVKLIKDYDNLITILTNIDAALFAFSIGISIYWRQKKDTLESLKSGLDNYCNYIIKKLPNSPQSEMALSGYLNSTYVNEIINSGMFNELLFELINFQGKIEFYILFCRESIRSQHKDNQELSKYHKSNIDGSYEILTDQAKKVKNTLQGME